MGLFATVAGEVEVRAVPGFSLTLTPARVVLDYGSVSMAAVFAVGIVRQAGHNKTVYLDLAGLGGNWTFSQDTFVPGVDAPVTLTIDADGFSKGMIAPFEVAGYDDLNDRPPIV
jgi:hypothetical protein